jgi:Flp pilus assembly protein protease CpaA
LAAFLIVFLIGLLLFNLGKLGGGDVKFLAALSLWAGLGELMQLLLVVTLAGGILSVMYLIAYFLRQPRNTGEDSEIKKAAQATVSYTTYASVADLAQTRKVLKESNIMALRVPYGVAIAVGAVYLFTTIIGHIKL